jgi:hypothetical protein
MSESYQEKLDRHSFESRYDPLRDAARRVIAQWGAEDNLEKNDLSEDFWRAMGSLEAALRSVRRGGEESMAKKEEEDVPEVEVTESAFRAAHEDVGETYERSPMPVDALERHPAARRSGAKNLSDPIYQNAFITEARAAMGQPDVQAAQALLGKYVRLTFNVDWRPAQGVLTKVVDDKAPYLMLDNYHERQYPLYAIEKIEELPHQGGSHGSGPAGDQ